MNEKKVPVIGICILLLAIGLSGCTGLESNGESELNAQIYGSTSGYIDEKLAFYGNATGGLPPYSFIWDLDNDGIYDDAIGETVFFSKHSSQGEGMYTISLKVTDSKGNVTTKNFAVEIYAEEKDDDEVKEDDNATNVENSPPNTPSSPHGPSSGKVGVYCIYSQCTTDPDGDQVSYRYDWGDGTHSNWTELIKHNLSFNQLHYWVSPGTYEVKVIAKDENGATSNWSPSLTVEISEGISEIIIHSIIPWMCSPQNSSNVGLKPTLKAFVNYYAPPDYKSIFLTWYTKNGNIWSEAKTIKIIENGDYYYYFEEADEYSTTYYWKVCLADDSGMLLSEYSFSFTTITISNAMPVISSFEPCYPGFVELQPMLSVEIYDPNGDKMDLTWYEKHNDVWMVTQIDQSLTNGTYHYTYETANEYNTQYCWKVRVTDKYGLYVERECFFHTEYPKITISNIDPIDGTRFYKHLNVSDGSLIAMSPHTFSATISNSLGNKMDIEFIYDTRSHGIVTNITQNVYDGTYSWTPDVGLMTVGDSTKLNVKVTDVEWGRYEYTATKTYRIERVWVDSPDYMEDWINFTKDGDSLVVTDVGLSGLSWNEIELDGIGLLPTGIINVGDEIAECSGTVSLRWVAVDMLIDSWTFT